MSIRVFRSTNRAISIVFSTIAALGMCAFFQPAWADGSKQAVVDMDVAINTSEPGKKLLEPLNRLMEQKNEEGKKLRKSLTDLRAKAEKDAPVSTEKQMAALQRQFDDKLNELRQFEADANQEIGQKRRDTVARFMEQLQPVIRAIGKEGDYAMITRKLGGEILYIDDKSDITALVVQRLNGGGAKGK